MSNEIVCKAFRAPTGELWGRFANHYFLLRDKSGVNVQPRASPTDTLIEVPLAQLGRSDHVIVEGVLTLLDLPESAWVYASDDELFYKTSKGTTYLVRQGATLQLRQQKLPGGVRFTVCGDPAVVQMTNIADDLED